MWELYAAWTWLPVFIAASLAARDAGAAGESVASAVAFAALAVGGIGCVWGGLVADRLGRERLVTWAMLASGACAALIGLTFGLSLWLLVPVALVWGFFVVADSAQFSVMVAVGVRGARARAGVRDREHPAAGRAHASHGAPARCGREGLSPTSRLTRSRHARRAVVIESSASSRAERSARVATRGDRGSCCVHGCRG